MSDSLRAVIGRQVVSKATAEGLGTVSHIVLDAGLRRLQGIAVGTGHKARVVPWAGIAGCGPDAVIVEGGADREPNGDLEDRAVQGAFDLIGRRALTDRGIEIGRVDDLTFDPTTGGLLELHCGDQTMAASVLRGAGSYAVVVAADGAA